MNARTFTSIQIKFKIKLSLILLKLKPIEYNIQKMKLKFDIQENFEKNFNQNIDLLFSL